MTGILSCMSVGIILRESQTETETSRFFVCFDFQSKIALLNHDFAALLLTAPDIDVNCIIRSLIRQRSPFLFFGNILEVSTCMPTFSHCRIAVLSV